jgi:hypothetical protein
MSISSNSNLSSTSQDNTSQILNDIQSLQDIEQQLFSNLEENQNLTQDQQKQIIQKINDISNMRINLYKTLNNLNSYFQNNLSNSRGTLTEQTSAIGIIENELNQSKAKLKMLEEEKNNKVRLIEINNYFGEKYAEHGNLMKIIIAVLLPVLILAILNKKEILPNTVYYILLGIIAVIGSYFFWFRLLSIWNRDNMNYQEYDWPFNSSNAPTTAATTSSSDPWTVYKKATDSTSGSCIGDACCSSGLIWDASANQCKISSNSSNSSVATNAAPVSKSSPTMNTGNNIESFMNNVLSKPAYQFKKPDVVLGSDYIKPNDSPSFIYSSSTF